MKRHHNMAPMYSDRRIVERARDMADMPYSCAALELGIGHRRLRRLIAEYGLVFSGGERAMRPDAPAKTEKDVLDHYMIAKLDGVKCKKCTKCREVKTIESFHRDKSKTTGRVSACKSCISSR